MHRVQAGEPDAEGWCLARSTRGGFFVSIPHRFNDFSMSTKTKEGVMAQADAVGTLTPAGVKYSVFKIRREDGKVEPNFLTDITKDFRRELKSERHITHAGAEGVEFTVANSRSRAMFRCFVVDDAIVQLIVEYPPHAAAEAEGNAKRFFESLGFDAPRQSATKPAQ